MKARLADMEKEAAKLKEQQASAGGSRQLLCRRGGIFLGCEGGRDTAVEGRSLSCDTSSRDPQPGLAAAAAHPLLTLLSASSPAGQGPEGGGPGALGQRRRRRGGKGGGRQPVGCAERRIP